MKKLLALSLTVSSLAFAMVGCGGDSKESSKNTTIDKNLVGAWYSDDFGGDMVFGDDNKISMSMDYSEIMYFDADQNLMMSGVACPSEYDGKTLSVVLGEEMGMTEEMEILTIERIGDADEDSIDGEYKLTGGELYTELNALYTDEGTTGDVNIIIDGETLEIELSLCEYKADGKKIEFTGEGVEILGLENEEDAVCDYEIDGDNLTLTESSGSTMEFTKSE
ncbi:MAG: hypothetical protein IJX77_02300 [Ruminococcus sp.]|nr:hypothetical protein [Ruminococcus sp.]